MTLVESGSRDLGGLRSIPRDTLRDLLTLNPIRTSFALLGDCAGLAGAYTLLAMPIWFGVKLLAATVAAVQMHRLAILGHEGAHFLLSRRRMYNEIAANVLCLYMFGVTVAGYRRWHFAHHRLVGTAKDTELCFKKGRRYQQPKSRSAFARMFTADLIGSGVNELVALAWAARPTNRRDTFGLLLYWLILVITLSFVGHIELIIFHFIIVATVFWAIFRVRGWSEHVGASVQPFTHRFTASGLVAYIFFPHNTWMHWEHHQLPSVPAYNLPYVRAHMANEKVMTLTELFDTFARNR